jgi:hypothetical protein
MNKVYKIILSLGAVAVLLISVFSFSEAARTADNVLSLLENIIRPDDISNSIGINMAPVSGFSVSTSTYATTSSFSLTATTTYYYKVIAIGPNGTTSPSVEATSTKAVRQASTTLATWTAQTGATHYRFYYGTTSGGQNKYFNATTTSFEFSTTSGARSGGLDNDNYAYSVVIASSTSYFLGSKVGIGTTSPAYSFAVNGTSTLATTTIAGP